MLNGDHDNRTALIEVFKPPVSQGRSTIDYSVALDEVRLICLDTLKPGSESGMFSAEQCAWLAPQLKDTVAKFTLIFMHHPPLDLALPT